MTTKELLQAEIDRVRPEDMDALYQLVMQFIKAHQSSDLAQAPDPIHRLGTQPVTMDIEDGSVNHDRYLYDV